MWTTIVSSILSLLTSIAGSTAESSTVNSIVTFLANLIPLLVGEASTLLQPVENIIANLESNGAVTAADMAAVEALRDQIDAAVDAQAKADGLTGGPLVPPAATTAPAAGVDTTDPLTAGAEIINSVTGS
jgi:hypothetical protein